MGKDQASVTVYVLEARPPVLSVYGEDGGAVQPSGAEYGNLNESSMA